MQAIQLQHCKYNNGRGSLSNRCILQLLSVVSFLLLDTFGHLLTLWQVQNITAWFLGEVM
jgi:hypothetical protein